MKLSEEQFMGIVEFMRWVEPKKRRLAFDTMRPMLRVSVDDGEMDTLFERVEHALRDCQ